MTELEKIDRAIEVIGRKTSIPFPGRRSQKSRNRRLKPRLPPYARSGSGCPSEQCHACVEMDRQCDRLAAYEDTGLMPDEIAALAAANADQADKLRRARDEIRRLQEGT